VASGGGSLTPVKGKSRRQVHAFPTVIVMEGKMLSFIGAHYDMLVIAAMGIFAVVLFSISLVENLNAGKDR
jgi:hypothetical protein